MDVRPAKGRARNTLSQPKSEPQGLFSTPLSGSSVPVKNGKVGFVGAAKPPPQIPTLTLSYGGNLQHKLNF